MHFAFKLHKKSFRFKFFNKMYQGLISTGSTGIKKQYIIRNMSFSHGDSILRRGNWLINIGYLKLFFSKDMKYEKFLNICRKLKTRFNMKISSFLWVGREGGGRWDYACLPLLYYFSFSSQKVAMKSK